jgi:O-antigen/teichoic acid export membrane protein
MKENSNKRIVKNTAMLYIRMLFSMVITLYTSRVILETLGIEDFGIYNVVGGIVIAFGFLNDTLSSGTQRFITFELGRKNFTKLKTTFSTTVLIHYLLAVVILILAETVGLWFLNHKMNIPENRMYAAQWVYQFSILATIVSIIQVPYHSSIIAHEKMNIYAYISIIEVTLKLLVVYLLLVTDYDKLVIYALLILVVNTCIMLSYRIYCIKNYKECKFSFIWDRTIFKSILKFSGWNIFGCLAFTGANQGVNIMLNLFFGPAVNAARGVSFQVSSAITRFVVNFQTAVNPQIVKLYANKDYNKLNNLLYNNSKYAFFLLWFLSLPVLLEIDTLLAFWLKEVPENAGVFCKLILLQSLIFCMHRPFVMAVHATGNMKQTNLSVGTVFLLIVPISYILLKNGYSAETPFIIYILATPIALCFELFFLRKWTSVSIRKAIIKIFIPAIVVSGLSFIVPYITYKLIDQGIVRFFLVCVSSVFSTSICIYYIGIEKRHRIYLINKIKTYLLKLTNK